MDKPPERANVPPNWQIYFRLHDVHTAAARITANGGKSLNRPMEVIDRALRRALRRFGALRVT
jgi:predicted enzyme related to lactoylglutathione lyase